MICQYVVAASGRAGIIVKAPVVVAYYCTPQGDATVSQCRQSDS